MGVESRMAAAAYAAEIKARDQIKDLTIDLNFTIAQRDELQQILNEIQGSWAVIEAQNYELRKTLEQIVERDGTLYGAQQLAQEALDKLK